MRSRKKSNHSLNVRVNSKKSIRVRRKIFFMKALKWSAVMMLAGLVLIGALFTVLIYLLKRFKVGQNKMVNDAL